MTKICPNCKNKNLDFAGFCHNCGEKLEKKVNIPGKNKNINGG
jgi:predicted amidophosphoribosyltransferase